MNLGINVAINIRDEGIIYMINYDYLFDKSHYDLYTKTDHFSQINLMWREYENATVLPFSYDYKEATGGLLDSSGRYVDGSGLHRGLGKKYEYDENQVKISDETIVLLGAWPGIWGHWLTDNIRRLWVLNDKSFMMKYGKCKFVYIPFAKYDIKKSPRELLKLLGIEQVTLERLDGITRYKKVILPDECFFRTPDFNRYYTKEYVCMIDKIREYGKENFRDTGVRKVYFTYRHFSDVRAMGEYRLEGFFKRRGYKIIAPEDYSFREQLNILLSCTEFASTIGSAAHNVMFLRDNTKVYLIPRADFITEYQFALNQIHNLDITFIDSSLSLYVHPDHPWGGPFYFIISENLQRCFGIRMKKRNNNRGFSIYRQLCFFMNGCQSPRDYYGKEYIKYLNMSPKRVEGYSMFHRLFQKLGLVRYSYKVLHKISLFCAKRRPDN